MGGKARTTKQKVRSRFILSTTSTNWSATIDESMAKTMSSQIIQINSKLCKKLEATSISNTKKRLFIWADRSLEGRLKLTISANRSSISREKGPVILAIRNK